MRSILLATAVFVGLGTSLANAEVLKQWQSGGPQAWSTVLIKRNDGVKQCMTMHDGRDMNRNGDIALAFVMDPVGSQVQVFYHFTMMKPENARVLIDGTPKFVLDTISSSEMDKGNFITRFNMPGDFYSKHVVPAMVGHKTITVEAGGRTFTTPIGNFLPVMNDIKACAFAGQK